jgi:alpha-beta hydrolase superfamily lysophospholipase
MFGLKRISGSKKKFSRICAAKWPGSCVSLATVFCAALLLSACAPRLQVQGTDYRSPALEAEMAVMADAARLPLQVWAAENPRAIILGLHGMNDYANAFDAPGTWFAGKGITLYAYDQRGFGQAPGRGLWAGNGQMVRDLETVLTLVRARHSGVPVYLLGTSMGGAVALRALGGAEDVLDVDGVVLAAPAVWGWSNLNPLYRTSLWLGAHVLPGQTLSGRGLEIWPSDNIEMLKRLGADPLVLKETRIDAVYGLVGLMEDAYQAAGGLDVPVLLLYGARDEIVPPEAVRKMAGKIEAPLTIAYYGEGYHMLLRDLQAETVYRDIAAWIENWEAPLPSGAVYEQACFTEATCAMPVAP